MQRLFVAFIVLINFTAIPLLSPVQNVQGEFQFENNEASISFPESVTFKAKITAPSEIEHIVLEYYTEQISCGKVIAKGFPEFDPATSVEVEWTWEMLQSGSIPTGAKIHWRWRVTTVNGEEGVSEEKIITWLDSIHPWENISNEKVVLNWYAGGQDFGAELHEAALKALGTIEKQIGLKTSNPIEIYIYANNQDFQEALLYEAGWTGGVAIPEYGIVLIGIDPVDLEWGKSTIAHEITHVLQGQYSFTCLGSSPTWLVEGIAMYAEGALDERSKEAFNNAIKEDTLYSVKALSGSFSENPNAADISYSQSYSLVNYLITKFGKQKLMDLMDLLSQGSTTDEALQSVYGFDINGFEMAWREQIGAKQPAVESMNPTPTAVPTTIPTIMPLGNEKFIFKEPSVIPQEVTPSKTTYSPIFLGMVIGAGIFLLIIIVIVAIIIHGRKSNHV